MLFRLSAAATLLALSAVGAEPDATAISRTIQARHAPFGAILDPIFTSPASEAIAAYTRCGDSAIWTGHYLAAEAYRFRVTGSGEALENASRALGALELLVNVTGTNLLARCAFPVDWEHAPGILREEQNHGSHVATVEGRQYYWIGNTSRDQYSGVFFGLSAAYEVVEDEAFRGRAAALGTRMVDYLRHQDWNVRMPDGRFSTSFALRPDQQLTILQIARQLNRDRFGTAYKWAALGAMFTAFPVQVDALDTHESYFKFNLNSINLFSLLRLEENRLRRAWYDAAYSRLRRVTEGHGNAHFNMIDRALRGPDEARDAETRALLKAWLQRPRRDVYVDLRGSVAACGENRACEPVPVERRVTTDFLWQRSPFQMYGSGDGYIEGAGVDYLLPYWMARYYGVLAE